LLKKGFEAAATFIRSGVTEADVVNEVERVCHEHIPQKIFET